MKNGVGDLLDGGGHSVLGIDGANDSGPALVAALLLYTNALDIGDNHEVLPYALCESALIELVAENSVCLAKCVESVTGDSTQATYAQTGTGEGLTVNHSVGQTKSLTNYSYLILEEKLHGLNECKLEILRKTAHVVMGLNSLLALCLLHALENVGVNSSLRQELDALQLSRLFCEYLNEFLSDDLSLALGITHACKKIKITVGSVDVNEICVEGLAENVDNRLALALSHKSVVYVHANQLLANSLNKQCRYDGGVYSTGKCEEHLLVADGCAYLGNLLCDERICKLLGSNSLHSIGSLVGIHLNILP